MSSCAVLCARTVFVLILSTIAGPMRIRYFSGPPLAPAPSMYARCAALGLLSAGACRGLFGGRPLVVSLYAPAGRRVRLYVPSSALLRHTPSSGRSPASVRRYPSTSLAVFASAAPLRAAAYAAVSTPSAPPVLPPFPLPLATALAAFATCDAISFIRRPLSGTATHSPHITCVVVAQALTASPLGPRHSRSPPAPVPTHLHPRALLPHAGHPCAWDRVAAPSRPRASCRYCAAHALLWVASPHVTGARRHV